MALTDHVGIQLGNEGLFALAIQQGHGESGYDSMTDYEKMSTGYAYPVTDEVIGDSASAWTDVVHFYSVTDLAFSPVKNTGVLPPETNRRAFPTGAFITGMWGQGNVSMIPRFDNRFGWILLAALGDVSTVSDTTIADYLTGTPGTDVGVYSHIFNMFDTHQFFSPWLTCYRLLPSVADGEQLLEVYQDGHFQTLTINAAAVSPVTVDMSIAARLHQGNYVFNVDAGWEDYAVFDAFEDFGVTSCDGYVKIEGVEYNATAVTVNWANQLLAPGDSIVIGSYAPLDMPVLARSLSVTVTFLVETYDLYVSIFRGRWTDVSALGTGGTGDAASGLEDYSGVADGDMGWVSRVKGINPECCILYADFEIGLSSQTCTDEGVAITDAQRKKLVIRSSPSDNNVSWQVAPVRLTPNRPIVMQVTAIFHSLQGTGNPVEFILQNDKINYDLPSLEDIT